MDDAEQSRRLKDLGKRFLSGENLESALNSVYPEEVMMRMTTDQFEEVSFRAFVMTRYPKLFEDFIIRNDNKALSIIKIMIDTWKFRANLGKRAEFIQMSDDATVH